MVEDAAANFRLIQPMDAFLALAQPLLSHWVLLPVGLDADLVALQRVLGVLQSEKTHKVSTEVFCEY